MDPFCESDYLQTRYSDMNWSIKVFVDEQDLYVSPWILSVKIIVYKLDTQIDLTAYKGIFCLLMDLFCKNNCLQIKHSNRHELVYKGICWWTRPLCLSMDPFCENDRLQIEHSNGLAPVCILRCIWSIDGALNVFPQYWQGHKLEHSLGVELPAHDLWRIYPEKKKKTKKLAKL